GRPKNGHPDEKPGVSQGSNGSSAPKAGGSGGRKYRIPTLSLLDSTSGSSGGDVQDVLLKNAQMLEEALSNFDVQGKIVEISPGPVVTRYEVEPAAGVKVNRIVTLSDDLARVMSAEGIRIQAPVPGKSVVGVEIANRDRETVFLSEVLDSKVFRQSDARLAMALGKTISGEPYVTDLAKMPHLLVAGATGAGKSVCINCLISSILFKATPDEVRLLMVDPKVVELTVYNGIPHLLVPVITEPKKASEALKWAVAEMESRYQLLAKLRVRSLEDYNRKVRRINAETKGKEGEGEEYNTLPCIVIVVDEFADLMLTAPADVETSLMSLAQKSRAIGIHLILATQRPSVNVITGVIKANFPSRIAFHVASKTDSRTILDMNGAERLLGKGDMLFLPGGQGEPIRIHGAFVSGEETERLVESIKAMNYVAEEVAVLLNRADINPGEDDRDELFDEAVNVVVEHEQASTSFLQRRMKIGYSRAARLMDELELAGIVGPAEGAKPRQIFIEGMAADEDALDS
ncbi:MAG: DNA translocase FtsK, partial [Pseudomonadales bacterium]